ncbi:MULTISPECIES: hypothetical protein [unclassified Streptomyces]|uniref:hypothetical protein n=1 Tax=unclassified Streptomyces TaxID=2593676 RepID=UPI00093DF4E8|nr:hypothetical protein [Streptomyces sp. TSRI0281]OKI38450.1 hypothetical protein A6A29_10885 [Streptomyces sp. TSRI0281]
MPPNPPARLRDGRAFTTFGLAAGLAVPAALLGGTPAAARPVPVAVPATAPAAVPASLPADQQPACGDPDTKDFPIDTRIHGGPDTYASGGGYGTWYLDLTNTTSESCRAIHPVLVLTDQDRKLTADQIQLEFSDGTGPGAEHRVTWETTDRDEQIGVFGGGESDEAFPGFTVPAGRTVTVQVRMAFTSDTRPGRVTANAAVVQRHPGSPTGKGAGKDKGDGGWVGESEDYPFRIVEGDLDSGEPRDSGGDGDAEAGTGTGTDPETGTDGTAPRPDSPLRDAAGNPLPELARTGQDLTAWAGITAGALFVGGSAMVVRVRRLRRGQD